MSIFIKEETAMSIEENDISWEDSTKERSEYENIKSKITSGEYKLANKRGRSKVWQIFASVVDEDNVPIDDIVACRSCQRIYKFSSSTSNLVRHKCYVAAKYTQINATEAFGDSETNISDCGPEALIDFGLEALVDSETKIKIVEAAADWAIENCRSLDILQDSGLKKLFNICISLGAQHGSSFNLEKILPHPTTLSQKVLGLYKDQCEIVKKEIAAATSDGYAITCNAWNDAFLRKSYALISIHATNQESMFNRVLSVIELENETGDNIRKEVFDQLAKFNCKLDEETAVIVTDCGLNLEAAFQANVQIHCISHQLNSIVTDAVRDIPQLEELLHQCNKLIKYLKNLENYLSLETYLKSCNSIFYTFSLVCKNWTCIPKNALDKNENLNLHNVEAIAKVLECIENALKDLEETSQPTLHLVIPHLCKLQDSFLNDSNDNDLTSQLKSYLTKRIESTIDSFITTYHKIALFLFPPTNALIQCSSSEKELILQACKNLMQTYWTDQSTENEATSSHKLFKSFIPELTKDNAIESEITSYQSLRISLTDNFNVLQWWSAKKNLFPLLYKVSCRIFGIPASSFLSERALSKARLLISENRNAVACPGQMVNEIIFLNSNRKTVNFKITNFNA